MGEGRAASHAPLKKRFKKERKRVCLKRQEVLHRPIRTNGF